MSLLMMVTALAAQTAAPVASTSSDNKEGPQAGSSTYVDLEAGAGYATNPILSSNDDTGSAFGRIAVHAVHTRISTRTTTVLSGFAQNLFYTNHYGAQQSIDLSGRHDARVSEKLRIFGDADFYYDKGGQLDTRILGVPNIPLVPGTTVPPVLLPDGSDFLSVTGRQYRAAGHVGAQLALSATDYVNASSGIEHVVFKSGSIDTRYTTIPVSIGYDRQINARTTIGARIVASNTEYNGPSSIRVITPEATIQTNLSERLTFTGDIGASFASIDDGVTTRHTTGLAADATLCSIGELSRLCARGSINEQAATAAGPARTISFGLDYSRRLAADDTINLSVNANRYSRPTSFITGQTFSHATYVRGAADYSRRLNNRLFGGVSLAARKVTESGPDPDADLSASLFLRYRFGDLR
jgi:hypothetical protein